MERVSSDGKERQAKPCPICGRPSVEAVAPFCSKRCANVDLHRWLGGVYAVPTDELDEDDELGRFDPDGTGGEH